MSLGPFDDRFIPGRAAPTAVLDPPTEPPQIEDVGGQLRSISTPSTNGTVDTGPTEYPSASDLNIGLPQPLPSIELQSPDLSGDQSQRYQELSPEQQLNTLKEAFSFGENMVGPKALEAQMVNSLNAWKMDVGRHQRLMEIYNERRDEFARKPRSRGMVLSYQDQLLKNIRASEEKFLDARTKIQAYGPLYQMLQQANPGSAMVGQGLEEDAKTRFARESAEQDRQIKTWDFNQKIEDRKSQLEQRGIEKEEETQKKEFERLREIDTLASGVVMDLSKEPARIDAEIESYLNDIEKDVTQMGYQMPSGSGGGGGESVGIPPDKKELIKRGKTPEEADIIIRSYMASDALPVYMPGQVESLLRENINEQSDPMKTEAELRMLRLNQTRLARIAANENRLEDAQNRKFKVQRIANDPMTVSRVFEFMAKNDLRQKGKAYGPVLQHLLGESGSSAQPPQGLPQQQARPQIAPQIQPQATPEPQPMGPGLSEVPFESQAAPSILPPLPPGAEERDRVVYQELRRIESQEGQAALQEKLGQIDALYPQVLPRLGFGGR